MDFLYASWPRIIPWCTFVVQTRLRRTCHTLKNFVEDDLNYKKAITKITLCQWPRPLIRDCLVDIANMCIECGRVDLILTISKNQLSHINPLFYYLCARGECDVALKLMTHMYSLHTLAGSHNTSWPVTIHTALCATLTRSFNSWIKLNKDAPWVNIDIPCRIRLAKKLMEGGTDAWWDFMFGSSIKGRCRIVCDWLLEEIKKRHVRSGFWYSLSKAAKYQYLPGLEFFLKSKTDCRDLLNAFGIALENRATESVKLLEKEYTSYWMPLAKYAAAGGYIHEMWTYVHRSGNTSLGPYATDIISRICKKGDVQILSYVLTYVDPKSLEWSKIAINAIKGENIEIISLLLEYAPIGTFQNYMIFFSQKWYRICRFCPSLVNTILTFPISESHYQKGLTHALSFGTIDDLQFFKDIHGEGFLVPLQVVPPLIYSSLEMYQYAQNEAKLLLSSS